MKIPLIIFRIFITAAMEVMYILASWSALSPIFDGLTSFIGITILHCSNESIMCGVFIGLLLYIMPIILFWLLTGWIFRRVVHNNIES